MKILIACPSHQSYGVNSAIIRAFVDFGCETDISTWSESYTFLSRTKLFFCSQISSIVESFAKPGIMVGEFQRDMIMEYNKKLLQTVNATKPDVLLALKGDALLPDTIKKLRENSNIPLVLWCYDSAVRFRNILNGGKYYHLFYTCEPSDIPELQKYGIRAKFLPMAYDPHTYFRLEDKTVVRDVCFVGTLINYPQRRRVLGEIISRYNELNIEVWGPTWSIYYPFSLYEYLITQRDLRMHLHNHGIYPREVNKIYNTSKICLNTHHPQLKEGLNPRVFEIMGAGGFQLVDYKKKLEELFNVEKEMVYYKNEDDLLEKVGYYIENEDERKKIAERGMDAVKKKHTYKHRAQVILDDIKKIR